MGTTNLLYGESNASDVLLRQLDDAKIRDTNSKLTVRKLVLAEIVSQMSGFQSMLDSALTESATFGVYNANPNVQAWRASNPKLLDTFYKTSSTNIVSESKANVKNQNASASINQSTPIHKFIILGWVDNISESESRTLVPDTNKTVVLYNLEIRCEYRMINPDNNKVVAIFVARGHGGIARILGSAPAPINYDMKVVVNDMFYSLAQNVRHILQLREDQYIKRRNNAKINVESAAKAK